MREITITTERKTIGKQNGLDQKILSSRTGAKGLKREVYSGSRPGERGRREFNGEQDVWKIVRG